MIQMIAALKGAPGVFTSQQYLYFVVKLGIEKLRQLNQTILKMRVNMPLPKFYLILKFFSYSFQ